MIHKVQSQQILKMLTTLQHSAIINGDIALIEDTHEILEYMNGEWIPKKNDTGIGISLYDLNATAINSLESHNDKPARLKQDVELINKTFSGGNMYMMLNHRYRYFTIFQNLPNKDNDFDTLGIAVITCAKNIGDILAVNTSEYGAIELWIRIPNQESPECFVLFNYDDGGVPYGI